MPLPLQSTPKFAATEESVTTCLKRLSSLPGAKSVLSKIGCSNVQTQKVPILQAKYNGDVVYELPPISQYSRQTPAKLMVGMDKKFDAHPWCQTKTSNIANTMDLTFCSTICAGHLKCMKRKCDFQNRRPRATEFKETDWSRLTAYPFRVGEYPPPKSTLVCKICRVPPTCLASCPARVYYVFGKKNMTRARVHIGFDDHPVGYRECRESKVKIENLVEAAVQKNPTAKPSAKHFLGEFLLTLEGEIRTILNEDELLDVMKKFYPLSSLSSTKSIIPRSRNTTIRALWTPLRCFQGCSNWEYIHENKFSGQGKKGDMVFVFKMSEKGPRSGVDLV